MNGTLAALFADGIYIGGGVLLVVLIILVVLMLMRGRGQTRPRISKFAGSAVHSAREAIRRRWRSTRGRGA